MLAIISPAKTLLEPAKANSIAKKFAVKESSPALFDESKKIIKELKKLSTDNISDLMDLSDKLAQLNYERFQGFSDKQNSKNASPAIFTFKGDVYQGLDVESLTKKEIDLLGKKVATLSGLYGLLKPFDLIQPYRLEMGTDIKITKAANLYKFWGNKISEQLNDLEQKLIINLASNEYNKAVDVKALKAKFIEANFMEKKAGGYKIVSFSAKKARGLMARYIVKNNVSKIDELKDFDYEKYKFNPKLSNESKLIFTRG